jgi:hypothetical protein
MMKRTCQKCGTEYPLGQLSFDSGLCGQCKPGFFGAPLWLQPVQAGTKDLWRTVLVIHVILFFLFGLILDCGEFSIPGGLYCLTIILYLAIRFAIARFRGYPILNKTQAIALLMLPVYGPAISITLFHWAQRIRWGT